MEYIRYYSTIILWASPFALSGIIRNYDGKFPSNIARTLFHPNNVSYVSRMIIRPSNESGRSRTIDIYVRCFPDSWPRRTHFHTTPDQPLRHVGLRHVPRGKRSQRARGIILCHLVKIQSLLILQGSIYNKHYSISCRWLSLSPYHRLSMLDGDHRDGDAAASAGVCTTLH